MIDNASLLDGTAHDFRLFSVFFAMSFLCHVAVFFLVNYLPGKFVTKRKLPSIINVDLASLPTPQNTPDLPNKAEDKADKTDKKSPVVKEQAPEKKTTETKKEKPAEKPVIKRKTSLKKQTYQSSKVLDSAREQIEKKVESSAQKALDDRLRALQKEVSKAEKGADPGAPANEGMGISGGARGMNLLDTYLNIIAFQISKNWNFSEQLAGGGKGLVVAIIFKIMPNGEIRDIWIEKRSGNSLLDESARKAIVKSSPVQPHPPGIVKPYIIGALEFTPSGIK